VPLLLLLLLQTPAAEAGVVSEPPKVPRPSRDKVNEQQADMTKEQQGLEDKIQALVTKRKSMQSKGDSGPVAAAKASFKELKVGQEMCWLSFRARDRRHTPAA